MRVIRQSDESVDSIAEAGVMRLRNILIVSATVVVWIVTARAQGQIEHDLVYGMYSGLALLMDVYHPEHPNAPGCCLYRRRWLDGAAWTGRAAAEGVASHW